MTKTEADQLIKQLKEYQKEITDRVSALHALEKAGLINKDGTPTEYYAHVGDDLEGM